MQDAPFAENSSFGFGSHQAAGSEPLSDDLLRGAGPIARFLGWTPRQVYGAHSRRDIPSFNVGHIIHARKSTLRQHIVALESGRLAKAS